MLIPVRLRLAPWWFIEGIEVDFRPVFIVVSVLLLCW